MVGIFTAWLMIVGSSSGFSSGVYLGERGFRTQPECIRALEEIVKQGYGGICTTISPRALGPTEYNEMTASEKADWNRRTQEAIFADSRERSPPL